MKKTVLTFGLIAGAILSVMMLITMPFHDVIGFDRAEVVGYTTMVLAFLLIFFGVRSYRDNVAGGTVRFGRALGVGVLIGLDASACYVATWEVVYFTLEPDYVEKYQARAMATARTEGKSEAELAARNFFDGRGIFPEPARARRTPYLQKPFTAEALCNEVRSALGYTD